MTIRLFAFSFSLIVTCSCARGAGNLVDGPNADLIYNNVNGNVLLDATGLQPFITSFAVVNEDASFRPENTRFPFLETGTNTINSTTVIAQNWPGGHYFSGSFQLGNIFPEGIQTSSELSAYLTEAGYSQAVMGPFEFDLIVVPEPTGYSALALLVLLFFPAANRRRRQDRVAA